VDHLWSPWRYHYLVGAEGKPPGCIFCNLPKQDRDEENLIVHRGRHNFVILNRFPYTSGHAMVVPYRHVDRLHVLEEAEASEMMSLAQLMEKHMREIYHPDGLNLGMNLGESAGAGIAGHIHMHILPRWAGDSNFMTTVGETRVLPEDLDVTWKRFTKAFSAVQK